MVRVKPKEYWYSVPPIRKQEAKEAGADYVGLDEMIQKVQGGWTDIDVVIAMPQVMAKVGRLLAGYLRTKRPDAQP